MSRSLSVIGFMPPDETWQKMKEVWDACKAAKIQVPEEIQKFFNYNPPDPAGVEIEIPSRPWNTEWATGVEIELDKVPKHVKIIRFFYS